MKAGWFGRRAHFRLQRGPARFSADSHFLVYILALFCLGCSGFTLTPAITTSQVPKAQAGAPYTVSLTAKGGLTPYTWIVASGALPQGVSLDRMTGALTGVPAQVGNFKFTVKVVDSTQPKPAVGMRGLNLVVAGPPPQIVTNELPNAKAGSAFHATLGAAGGVPPYHWGIAAGALPSGLVLNDAGAISGTPAQPGQFDFAVQLSDSSSPKPQTDMNALRLAVVALALEITSGVLPAGQVGAPFQATLSASGGVWPYTWTIVGALPPGLSLNTSSGAIAGTPTQAGRSTPMIHLTDSSGQTAQREFLIAIGTAGSQPLAITTVPLPQAVVGQPYSTTLQATGGTPGYTWSIAGQLPSGLTLSAAAGKISGTPSATGQFSLTAQVQDSGSPAQTASRAFNITVSAAAALDQYGGDASHPCAGTMKNGSAIPDATGFFYLYKDTNLKHWMLCDPLGNRFWYQGVSVVFPDYTGGSGDVNAKYGSGLYDWMKPTATRLQSLGFNAIGAYAHLRMLPASTQAGTGNPNKMPFLFLIRPSTYALATVKSLVANLPPIYTNYRGSSFPDVFDPQWITAVNGWFSASDPNFEGGRTPAALDKNPYYIGTIMDDSDQLFGFKQSASIDSGWMVGISSPYQPFIYDGHGTVYPDPKFYLKDQLKTFLTTKYGTIGALNAVWGSNYTTFGSSATTVTSETIGTGDGTTTSFSHTFAHGVVDPISIGISIGGTIQAGDCPWFNGNCTAIGSGRGYVLAATGNINGGAVTYASGGTACGGQAAPCITVTFSSAPANGVAIAATYQYGGWPRATAGGTGLLDEDGTSSWYPTNPNLPSCFPDPAGCVGTVTTDLNGFYTPLAQQYFSTINARLKAALPHHLIIGPDAINLPNRNQVLSQEAAYVDVAFIAAQTLTNAKTTYDLMGIPQLYYTAIVSLESKFVYSDCSATGWPCSPNQSGRGAMYQANLQSYVGGSTTYVGTDGYGFVGGIDWWQFTDRQNEQQNFGLVTLNDNLYDGFECTTAKRTDPWGFVTTPETRNYGDFVSSVKAANRIWLGR